MINNRWACSALLAALLSIVPSHASPSVGQEKAAPKTSFDVNDYSQAADRHAIFAPCVVGWAPQRPSCLEWRRPRLQCRPRS